MQNLADHDWLQDVERADVLLRSGAVQQIVFYRDAMRKAPPKLLLERGHGDVVRYERRENAETYYGTGSIHNAFGNVTTDLARDCQRLFCLAVTTRDGVFDVLGHYPFDLGTGKIFPRTDISMVVVTHLNIVGSVMIEMKDGCYTIFRVSPTMFYSYRGHSPALKYARYTLADALQDLPAEIRDTIRTLVTIENLTHEMLKSQFGLVNATLMST